MNASRNARVASGKISHSAKRSHEAFSFVTLTNLLHEQSQDQAPRVLALQNSTMKHLGTFGFIALLASCVAVAWRPLLSTFKLGVENDEYTHILLILPVTLTFLYTEWKSLRSEIKPSVGLGSLLLCLAALTAVLPRLRGAHMAGDLQLSIQMLALVTWWIGSFVLCFGQRIARLLVFPLCFLYWMVPLSSWVLNEIVKSLQQGSAFATKLFFAIAGVPLAQDGLMLSIPGLTIEVAKECSSIRSSLMLLVTTMVLAQLLLRSPWRKALVIALAVPLSVVKNGFRIFTIAWLGTRVDPGYLHGRLHRQGGVIFFAISLLAIVAALLILQQTEQDPPSAKRHSPQFQMHGLLEN
jgi:exosortase